MRHLAFTSLLFVPFLCVSATAAPTSVGDVVADRQASWAAEDGVGGSEAGPVQTPVPTGAPGAPATPRQKRAADPGPAGPKNQQSEVAAAAEEAQYEIVRAKLAAADAIAARASSGETKRISLSDFQLLVQRATCASAHGELEVGEGAACMAKPAVGADVNLADNEEAQLCHNQGGVLVARMDPCLQASAQLTAIHADGGATVGLEALLEAFAEMARQCWGQTLCVE